jgi:NADH dehydrogenase
VIVLTGGTGFVGQRLARQLTAQGRAVRVLSRNPHRVALPGTVEWAAGDLTDPSSLSAALKGAETVIHLAAALPGGRVPTAGLESANVGGTAALASAARAAGVRRFIHVSSAGVYGDGLEEAPHREADPLSPATPYERSKLEAERALKAALEGSSVSWTILRPPGLYAADRPATAAFFREVARRRLWLHGPARVWVHPTHVLDLVDAIVRTLDHRDLHREVLNVGGGRPVEFRELIGLVGARLGHTPQQVSMPRWSGYMAAGVAGAWRLAGAPPAMLQRLARRRVNRTVDIEKARRLLGFEPVALEWGLDQTATELREMGLLAGRAARPAAKAK